MTPHDTCHHCDRPLFEGVFCSRCRRWFDKYGSTSAVPPAPLVSAAQPAAGGSGAVAAVSTWPKPAGPFGDKHTLPGASASAPPLHSDD